MAKSDFMPKDDTKKGALFLHVAAILPTYFTRLSIGPTTAQVLGQAADAAAFDYAVRAQRIIISAGQEATAAKNRLRDGDPERPGLATNVSFPTPLGTVPTAVLPGVVARFRLFVTWLNGLSGFGDDIAEAAKITGAEHVGTDLDTVKPVLPLILRGGHVFIDWDWGGHSADLDGLELQVDRGTGTFTLLTIDMRPGYLDTEPLPATSGVWRYKGIYRKNDSRVGLWSDVASIPVG